MKKIQCISCLYIKTSLFIEKDNIRTVIAAFWNSFQHLIDNLIEFKLFTFVSFHIMISVSLIQWKLVQNAQLIYYAFLFLFILLYFIYIYTFYLLIKLNFITFLHLIKKMYNVMQHNLHWYNISSHFSTWTLQAHKMHSISFLIGIFSITEFT